MNVVHGRCVLVTGAAGFLGANLVRALLRNGAQVHGLVRPSTNLWRLADVQPSLTLHRVDLMDFPALRQITSAVRPEFVFHLASPSGQPEQRHEREEYLRTCVLGTANLLETTAALDYHRLVHVGSLTEYGPKKRPMKEDDIPEPSTYRGMAKAAATLLCRQSARMTGRPIVVLRSSFVYGPWDSAPPLIPTVIRAVLRGEAIALTQTTYQRDFVFVEDVVEACLLSLDPRQAAGEIINIGSGKGWSSHQIAEAVQDICRRTVPVRVGGHPAHSTDTTHWIADIRKARKLLGWSPRHSFHSGLGKTVSWFRENLDRYAAS